MLEREEVLSAYRTVLGREPDSEAILECQRNYPSLAAFRAELLRSQEYRRRVALGDLPAATECWVCAEIRYGLRLWLNLMDLGVGVGALRGDWKWAETQFVLSQLDVGDCFVDVGANIGWFTVLGARKVGPLGRVHAFEPRFDLLRRLRDSIAANGMLDRCAFHNLALGSAEGEMLVAAVPSAHNPGHSFLVRGDLEPEAVAYGAVKIRHLDDFEFEKPVDLIKIDVEGAEALALAGGRKLLKRDKPLLVSEFFPSLLRKVSGVEPHAYLNLLRDIGYRIFELTDDGGVGVLIPDLPSNAEREGFRINVVATCEPKVFKPVERMHQLSDSLPPPIVVDDSRQGLNQRLYGIEANMRRHAEELAAVRRHAGELAAAHRNSLSGSLANLAQAIEFRFETSLFSRIQDLGGAINLLSLEARKLKSAQGTRLNALRWAVEQKHRELREDNVAAAARLSQIESQLSALTVRLTKTKSLPKKIFREIWRPFRRRFWMRRRGSDLPTPPAQTHVHSVAEPPAGVCTRDDPPPPVAPIPVAAPCLQGASKPVAMIIDHRWPEPDRDSGSLDAVNLVRSLLESGYHVLFAVETIRPQDPRYIEGLRALGGSPVTLEDAPDVPAFVTQQGQRVDLFVLTRVGTGGQYLELIRCNCPHAKIIFNTVDLHFMRELRMARVADDAKMFETYERTRDREEFLVAKSDATFVMSVIEEEILQASVPGCSTTVLPLARNIRRVSIPFEQRAGFGFVGGFEHTPNIDAVEYFLRDIWPRVRRRDPSLVFQIVGSNLPERILDGVEGHVEYLGPLPSIEPWLDSLRLSVAPLRIGAGAKGKVASSLCNGLPSVISSIAAEGMHLESGVGVWIADNPEEFAEYIVKVHSDPELWAKLAKQTYQVAEARLSYESFRGVVRKTLTRLELPTSSFPPIGPQAERNRAGYALAWEK